MSWPTIGVTTLIDAMVQAEGGPDAMVRAVRISVPSCKDYKEARGIALNTIAHLAWDMAMVDIGHPQIPSPLALFVSKLGARWAPIGADNDPTDLNKNWVSNVLAALRESK